MLSQPGPCLLAALVGATFLWGARKLFERLGAAPPLAEMDALLEEAIALSS
jgi:hypothetical protein